jgi:1,4-alpha-glucan branching enzyme
VEHVLRDAAPRQGLPPVLTAMYDTELFGHWWFEGPHFVAAVLDACAPSPIQLTTAGAFVERNPPLEVVALPEGSWGDGGHHQVWLNEQTAWTWKTVHAAEARYERLALDAAAQESEPLRDRLLNQAGRELLLLEASDWQFLITTVSARDYAELRLTGHAETFDRLAALAAHRLQGGALSEADEQFLSDVEARDCLFPDYDWRAYSPSLQGAMVGH